MNLITCGKLTLVHSLFGCSLMEVESDEDVTLPSQQSSHTSDVSFSMNSGVSSGSEDSRDTSFVSYEESSDDSDFLSH